MEFNVRGKMLNLFSDTPVESLVRSMYMYLFQRDNFHADRQTVAVMEKVLRTNSNCIDVGCYRGEILKHMLRLSPLGKIFAFEPAPSQYQFLKNKFSSIDLFPLALDQEKGQREFYFNRNYPARSGLFPSESEGQFEEILVHVDTLDNMIPPDVNIAFIKIDAEGAELGVISGGKELIKRSRPVIVFEHGGDGDGSSPGLYDLLCREIGLKISTMDRWLRRLPPFKETEFMNCILKKQYSNFIAY